MNEVFKMDENKWIENARKLLIAIKFNVEHPSHKRDVIGGLEIGLINDLLKDYENLTKNNSSSKKDCLTKEWDNKEDDRFNEM